MAGTMQFDLVSPERRLASVAATEVQIPAAEGDLTAMAGHSPTITTLRPGVLRAVSVLAERAIPTEEATAAVLDGLIAEARGLVAGAADKDAAEKMVDDMTALKAAVGV